MIVATAGHIDHGKTALIKALTGVDTDRLPEEKARGISIDLGFAYWKLPDGTTLGFVDVPGHERFVRNMLAGVCGIDFVMLVVAADDGVMPQTVEHFHIVDLLGVSRGIVVITKIDRVAATRVTEVVTDVRDLLATSRLRDIAVLRVSAVTGEGVEALRRALADAAAQDATRRAIGRGLRFAVDRAFSIAGSGTVVTGTVFDGVVSVGDRLTLSPGGVGVRVRGIQKAGVAADAASAGERAALNLAGVDVEHVARGDWVVALHSPTQRLDVALQLLDGAAPGDHAQSLRHWSRVHLHIGAANVSARIAVPRGASIDVRGVHLAQLVLDQPIATVNGDRFILRDQSALHTIGGGVVIDPLSPRRRGPIDLRTAQLQALRTSDPAAALDALLAATPGGIDMEQFQRTFNLDAQTLDGLVRKPGLVVIKRARPMVMRTDALGALRSTIVDVLAQFHREHPQASGMDLGDLRAKCAPQFHRESFGAIVRAFASDMGIEIAGSTARRVSHVATANRADDVLWQRIKPLMDDAGFRGLSLGEIALDARVAETSLKDFLHRKAPTGEVVRVTAERFYPRGVMAKFAALAQAIAASASDQQFTAAQYRDRAGINRTLAIEVLECLDRLQITQRVGDVRKMRKDFVPILGAATVPPAPTRVALAAPAPSKPGAPARKRWPSLRH